MLLTHDLNSSRNDIDLLVPPCPYLIFFCGRCHHLLQQSYTSRMTVHGRMWPCAAAAVCDSCTLGATPGCTNWRHGAFPSTALAELHPGEGPGQQPPQPGAAAWDTAAASFPSLSRPGLGADRPGNKPKIGRAVWDCLTLLVSLYPQQQRGRHREGVPCCLACRRGPRGLHV